MDEIVVLVSGFVFGAFVVLTFACFLELMEREES
jgi:hypothetical protein